ncbi:MAG TPA: MFS transporter [Chloroflexota bacterium]|nr:MFS transporter [Chloroflexota bacterium]
MRASPSASLRAPRLLIPFYYGWLVAALAFSAAFVSAGIRAAPSVFIHPFEAEFGWNRAAIAGAISVNLLLYGLGAPVSGRLIDRFGPRKVVTANLLVLGAAVAATIGMNALWQLTVLWGLVIGLAAGGSSVLAATVASRWFVRRRGLVIGLLGTATSTGQVVFVPLLMMLVVGVGWRGASITLALAAALTLVPVALFMRDEPAEVGVQAYGAANSTSSGAGREQQAAAPAVPLSKAIQSVDFWLLTGSFFVCGATSNGLVGTHLIPHAIDHGIPEVTAAAAVGLMGGLNFVGTLGSGWLTDRVDPRRLLAAYYGFRGIALMVLPFVTWFPGLFIFAILFGLDWYTTVPATTMLSSQLFGKRSIGTIYGWIFFSHQVGAATSALAAGAVRVWLGDYQVAFFAGALVCVVGASLALLIRDQRAVPQGFAASGAAA